MNIFDRIADKLAELGAGFPALCRDSGISYETMASWRGEKLPTSHELIVVSSYLGTTVYGLLGEDYEEYLRRINSDS